MSRTSRQKEKFENGSERSEDNVNEGTAARTRPFSYDKIMLKRKEKSDIADDKDGARDPSKLSGKEYSDIVSGHSESHVGHKRGKDSDAITKHAPEDIMKRNYRKKEETALLKENTRGKDKGKESRDPEAKLKDRSDQDTSIRAKDSNSERHSRHRGRNDEHLREENEPKKRNSENLTRNEKHKDSERVKSRESKRKNLSREEEKNKQVTDGNSYKKYDSGRYVDSEPADRRSRKKDTSQSHYEDTRPKRRRSRSREARERRSRSREARERRSRSHEARERRSRSREVRERRSRSREARERRSRSREARERRSRSREAREIDRKSVSPSPRANKRTYHEREHGDSSLNSLKDRRQHSDVERNLVTSNGGYTSSQRRHSGHGSKLGGYSPRKRRTEAAIKTPSPTTRSPEKKNAGWDLPPMGATTMSAVTVLSTYQQSHQTVSTSAVPVTPPAARSLSEASPNTVSMTQHVSTDSIQLTEATRPMRRLFVENLPSSASDKSIVECLNKFLLSSGANHIQGTQPCISCTINKEKGQALVEFLTPDYATVALSFDGRSFSGSVLKIRRPKDFVDATTGVPEKSESKVDAISDIVKDSPHKIFIGGISKILSSDMLREIVHAFGVLKAYRFQVNEDLHDSCAFLEYVDQALTLKACAGLNGMKLGGQVLTVVRAFPDASFEDNIGKPPFYGIPEHAKPLLSKPTKVLKLKNVFDAEYLLSVSGPDFEEILEDIRLESARFGTVRSVNVVRGESSCATDPQAVLSTDQTNVVTLQDPEVEGYTERREMVENKDHREILQDVESEGYIGRAEMVEEKMDHTETLQDLEGEGCTERAETAEEKMDHTEILQDLEVEGYTERTEKVEEKMILNPTEDSKLETSDVKEPLENVGAREDAQISDSKPGEDLSNSGVSECQLDNSATPDVTKCVLNSDVSLPNSLLQRDATENEPNNGADFIQYEECSMIESLTDGKMLKEEEDNGESRGTYIQLNEAVRKELDASDNGENGQQVNKLDDIFEVGCILVEYARTEASCMAAHCLHGRLYGDRVVVVNYVPHDLYLSRFPK